MRLYYLTYDLRKKRNYAPLYAELKHLNAVRILESTWCFKYSGASCKDIREHFKQFIETDDGLMVSEVVDWASVGTLGTPNDLTAAA